MTTASPARASRLPQVPPPEVSAWVRRAMCGPIPEMSASAAAELASLPGAPFLETVIRNRVAPWILEALRPHRELVPPALWHALEQADAFQVGRTLAHYVGMLRLLEWANSADVPVVILKGAAVAHRWYADPRLRPYSDVDVMVNETDVDALVAYLLDQGQVEKAHTHAHPVHEEHGEFQRIFTHPTTGQIVEVHVNHLQIGLRPVGMRDIWERSEAMPFHRTVGRVLERDDLFVHLAVHLHRHGFDRLIWFKDLDLMIRSGTLNWRQVSERAAAQGCTESLSATLELLPPTLGTPMPPEALAIIRRRGWIARWLSRRIWRPADVTGLVPRRRWRMRRAVQFAPETGLFRGTLLALLFTGRRRDKLRVLAARMRHRSA